MPFSLEELVSFLLIAGNAAVFAAVAVVLLPALLVSAWRLTPWGKRIAAAECRCREEPASPGCGEASDRPVNQPRREEP